MHMSIPSTDRLEKKKQLATNIVPSRLENCDTSEFRCSETKPRKSEILRNPCKHHFETINNMYPPRGSYFCDVFVFSSFNILFYRFMAYGRFRVRRSNSNQSIQGNMERWAIARMGNKWKRKTTGINISTNHLEITFNWTEYVNRNLFAAAVVAAADAAAAPTAWIYRCVLFYSFPSTTGGAGDLYFSFNSIFFVSVFSSKSRWLKCNDIILCFDMCTIAMYFLRFFYPVAKHIAGRWGAEKKKLRTTKHLTFLSIKNHRIETNA